MINNDHVGDLGTGDKIKEGLLTYTKRVWKTTRETQWWVT